MKLSFAIFIILSAIQSNAQTKFESPYVNDGKSFEVKIPVDFYESTMAAGPFTIYSKDINVDTHTDEGPTKDLMMTGVFDNFFSREMSFSEFTDIITAEEDGLTLIDSPVTIERNNRVFHSAGYTGTFQDTDLHRFYIYATEYKEVAFILIYIQLNESTSTIVKKDLEFLMNNFTEITTDRESEFDSMLDYDNENSEDVEFEENFYRNSKFETALTYDDIFFYDEDLNLGWEENFDEDFPELLIAFDYLIEENNEYISYGGVKAFSGGNANSYSSTGAMLKSLQIVFPLNKITAITFNEEVEGTEHTLKKYSIISNSDEMKTEAVYTTLYNGEMIFMLCESYGESTEEFLLTSESFVKSLWFWKDGDIEGEE